MTIRRLTLALGLLVASCPSAATAQSAVETPSLARQSLTRQQMADFLQHAKVIGHKSLSKGITKPIRLTLSDGTLTHDAVFQSVDETLQRQQFTGGRLEINFRDSYHYNIAAYRLGELVGVADMLPVTVEREWDGRTGSLAWWIDWKWDELMRRKQDLRPPPDREQDYSKQLHLSRVFSQLVYDTDRNQTNMLITADWRLFMIDFTRAFRAQDILQYPESIQRCSRDVLARLEALTRESVTAAVGGHVEPAAIKGLLARRDKIVARIRELVRQRGEESVLF